MSKSSGLVFLAVMAMAFIPSPSKADPFKAVFNMTFFELLEPKNLLSVLSQVSLHDWSQVLMFVSPDNHNASMHVADVPMTGGLAPNTKLDNATKLNSTVTGARFGAIKHPQALALLDNYLYTGIIGGDIIRLNLNDPNSVWQSVYQLGTQKCEHEFQADECGFASAMQFDADRKLIVSDSVHGLLQIDILGNGTSLKLSPEKIDDLALKNIASVAIGTDGIIYFTSSGPKYEYYEDLMEMVNTGSGRVLKYDPSTKETTVLMDNLNYVCSVEISDDGNYLIVLEGNLGKLWKYLLTGAQQGMVEEFGLVPGIGGSVRSRGNGLYLVGVLSPTVNHLKEDTLNAFNDFILPSPKRRSQYLEFFTAAKKRISDNKQKLIFVLAAMQGNNQTNAVLSFLDQNIVDSCSLNELIGNIGGYIPGFVNVTLQKQVYKLLEVSDDTVTKVTTLIPLMDEYIANSSSVIELKQYLNEHVLGKGLLLNLANAIDGELDKWLMANEKVGSAYNLVKFGLKFLLGSATNTSQFINSYNGIALQITSQTDFWGLLQSKVLANLTMPDEMSGILIKLAWPLIKDMDEIIESSVSLIEVVNKKLTAMDYYTAYHSSYSFMYNDYGLLMELNDNGTVVRSWQSPSGSMDHVNQGIKSGSDIFVTAGNEVLQLSYDQ